MAAKTATEMNSEKAAAMAAEMATEMCAEMAAKMAIEMHSEMAAKNGFRNGYYFRQDPRAYLETETKADKVKLGGRWLRTSVYEPDRGRK
ncbi:hypothetical protein BDZ91DRAFT_796148 [Kalaharituber pfeilii]|nr:hypothetical protein BDZ91DRAFT_796148 [Kalaharituber pfeilii]